MTLTGTDVSSYQGDTPNLDGLDFVIVKATQGIGYVNPSHAPVVAAARAAGKLAGHYHFLDDSSPEAQAQYFWDNAGWIAGEQLAVDVEAPFADTPGGVDATRRFVETLLRISGFPCELYIDYSHLHSADWAPVAALGSGLWGAAYNDAGFGDTGPFGFVAIWQNSDKSTSGGDSDVFYGDAAAWHKYGTPPGQPLPAPAATVVPPAPAPSGQATYPVIVTPGDTLTAIAAQFSVTLEDLETANPGITNPDQISAGQVINVPTIGATPPASAAQCVVSSGDTLGSIASQFGTTVDSILAKNPGITNPDMIFPGQVINL